MILVVMNLVRLAKEAPYFWLNLIFSILEEIIRKIGEYKWEGSLLFLFPKCRFNLFQ